MFRWTVALMIALLTAAPALGQLPVDPDPEDLVDDAEQDAEAAAGAVAEDVGDAADAGADATASPEGADHSAYIAVGYTVTWGFDLPLRDDAFAMRSVDGEIRESVNITTTWHRGDAAKAPDDLRLHLRSDDARHTLKPTHENGSAAAFVVPQDMLFNGAHTGWRIAVSGQGATEWWAAYAGGNTSEAFPEWSSQGTTVWAHDSDEDGYPDDADNCPYTANDQANMDGDIHGDACDQDIDGDGWSNADEEAAGSDPYRQRSTPEDRDADGFNNTEEAAAGADPDDPASTPDDPDADGHNNTVEAGAGSDPHDAASTPLDPDADGLENQDDNCARDANPDQADHDEDGIGDACDTRPEDGPAGDQDDDGIANRDDNCRRDHNPDQANLDGDRRGDACDADIDGDDHVNWAEPFPRDATEWADNDGDGIGDNADQDDDNDGLSDDAETATGTDPKAADSDGDSYSDLDEMRLGSDPLDRYDPEFRPTDVEVRATGNGTARIAWTGSDDPRVASYTVWVLEDRRIVGSMAAGPGEQALTDDEAGDSATYVVQAVFHGAAFHPDARNGTSARIYAEDVQVWQSQAAGDGPAPAAPKEDLVEPVERGAPAVGIVMVLALLALAARFRR